MLIIKVNSTKMIQSRLRIAKDIFFLDSQFVMLSTSQPNFKNVAWLDRVTQTVYYNPFNTQS